MLVIFPLEEYLCRMQGQSPTKARSWMATKEVGQSMKRNPLLWQHHLGLHKTKVYMDDVPLKYFETQTQMSAKQWHWHDTLAPINVDLIHKPGRDNVVLAALSRQEEL
jgi:hypothetical protein